MPRFETKNFAAITYDPEAVIEFPSGVPGFEERRRFLALTFPDTAPLVFLQSLEDSGLCFIALPVLAVDAAYRLEVSPEDRLLVELAAAGALRIGTDVLCLVIVSLRETMTTANLLAPIVVNLRNQKAVQAIAPEGAYSHQYVLTSEDTAVCS